MQFEASMLMPERTRPSRQEIVIILSDNRLNNSPNVSSFDFRNSAYKGTTPPMQELKPMLLIRSAMTPSSHRRYSLPQT
jgi:hypothetical protein